MARVVITKAEPKDAAAIQKVFYDTWVDTYPNSDYGITVADLTYRFRDLQSEESIEKLRKLIVDLSTDSSVLFLVAKVEDTVVGVSMLEKEPSYNRLQSVYIVPEYQGQGIGIRFWETAKSFFDLTKDTILDVAVYNQKAIEFYTHLGFVDTGKRFTEEKTETTTVALRPMMEMVLPAKVP